MDPYAMSPEDMRNEAERRRQRRERGLPLTPELPELDHAELQRIAEDDSRLEKEIQADVRKLYIAFGCEVYNLSQARASKQTPGLGDLVVFHPRLFTAWWHEAKTPSGVFSPDQLRFWELCAVCSWRYVSGGVVAAEEQLIKIGAAYRTTTGALEPRHNQEK